VTFDLEFDHIVVGCLSLPEGVAHVEAALGVRAGGGGKHGFMATHNHVLRLGERLYLEVIAVDPDAPKPSRPRWFNLDDAAMQRSLKQGPRIIHWVVRTRNIEAAVRALKYDPGPVVAASRGDLSWKITIPDSGALPMEGAAPTIIEWPDGRHVSAAMQDQGCILEDFTIHHPRAEQIAENLSGHFHDSRVKFETAETVSLMARIQTAHGLKQIS
jgi:hypothetical protein